MQVSAVNLARGATLGALVAGVLAGVAAAPNDVRTLAVLGRSNGTPSIAADGPFVAVAWGASAAKGGTDIYIASSRDAGRTLSAPVRVNDEPGSASVSGEQPPRVALVPHAGGAPSVVVVWTAKSPSGTRIFSSRSDDGGRSFTRSRALSGVDAPGNRGWESIVTGSDGRVAVVWLDHRELAATAAAMPMNHAAMPMNHEMPAHPAGADGADKAQLSKLYFGNADGSGGRAITGGVCYCCKTGIATGVDGSLYAVWRHVYPGNIRDIAFTVSRDNGKTFAAPVRVSEDKWMLDGCPENGPALAAQGRDVHVVWPTLVAGAGTAEPTLALFYAATRDGRAFTPRQRVPTDGVPRHPQVAVGADGALLAVWDEAAGGGRRRVVLATAGTDTSRPVTFTRRIIDDTGSAQYPVVATTRDGAVVAWTSGPADASVIRLTRTGT